MNMKQLSNIHCSQTYLHPYLTLFSFHIIDFPFSLPLTLPLKAAHSVNYRLLPASVSLGDSLC